MVLLSEKLGEETTGVTVSRYCASSLDAVRHASNAIKNGEGDAYVAAGVEFVSRFNERSEVAGADDRNEKLTGDHDGYPNVYIDMGITAVNVAERYGVSRDDMDDYAPALPDSPSNHKSRVSSTARSSRSRPLTARSPRTTARVRTRATCARSSAR